MEFTRGKRTVPQRVVVYGPEGIGKTTLAAKFPSPVFIDIEGGSNHLDVVRTPVPTSWTMLTNTIRELSGSDFQTIVIDSADWAEKLCIAHVCAEKGISALGGQEDYGHSYGVLRKEWARFLDQLKHVTENGINVVLLAHSQLKKFEQPDEAGAYDRYTIKMEKKTGDDTKEWAEMLLFANFRTIVTKIEGTNKAAGNKRVLYTTRQATWDAKNRHGLPDEIPLSYEPLAPHIPNFAKTSSSEPEETTQETTPVTENSTSATSMLKEAFEGVTEEPAADHLGPLYDLMKSNDVTAKEIQAASFKCGYFPIDTPIENYPEEYVNGKLVASWEKVFNLIKKIRQGA